MQNLPAGVNKYPKCRPSPPLHTNYKYICSNTMKLMASTTSKPFNFKPQAFIFYLLFLSLVLLFITLALQALYFLETSPQSPEWLLVASRELRGRRAKVGFVNIDGDRDFGELHGLRDRVQVPFDRVAGDVKWGDLFPEWIDEDQKWAAPVCPEVPLPRLESFLDVDVVVARAPCGDGAAEGRKGVRDVFRLQVNLLVAKLAVESGLMNGEFDRTVVVVFVGLCGPMVEIFRCDDLVMRGEHFWVYRPDLKKLKQKLLMPIGSCQLAPPYAESGKEKWRKFMAQSSLSSYNYTFNKPREAYATVLHSSEAYVCGAIALAQSIIRTGSTRDLVLLADGSISPRSLKGLKAAGWKIRHIERIRSPHAKKKAYNEWNYSKLRVWQLTEYDKIIFIDADFIVLRSMDSFFVYPQLSAVGNDKVLFNSGIMMVEPSECMFRTLLQKTREVVSYNGGDQGFLNEVFTWWHRWPKRLNFLTIHGEGDEHETPADAYAIHYLGLKPWMCYRDYDCNWDMQNHHPFASDSAHRRWWELHDAMPESLWGFCSLTRKKDARIRKWRKIAQKQNLSDGHWKMEVRDPRQQMLVDS